MSLPFKDLRIGQGLDVHPLVEGRACILGGVRIVEASHGPAGHSDGDVLLHAVMDALLGACGKPDIGHFFPSSGPGAERWRGADSRELTRQVMAHLLAEGWRVWNVDCTVLTEAPRISPYVDAIKESLASLLGIPKNQVALKATTAERLGFVGRGEGILASSVVLIVRD